MQQMDFANPLTASQVVWLVIIVVALYFILSRWALPSVGAVLADRARRIEGDLTAAHAGKADADAAVAELNAAMKNAREEAHAEIAKAVSAAKAVAAEEATRAATALEAKLEAAEREVAAARHAALAAIRPVALETAKLLVDRLTGVPANDVALGGDVDAVLAARKA